jgi:Uma2 family endonuclease
MTITATKEAGRMATADLMTAEQFLLYPGDGRRVELVRGQLVVREPPGFRHGEIAARIVAALIVFLDRDRERSGAAISRGRVLTCDAGFTLARDPDTVRGPDVAYVSRERWSGPSPQGFGEVAPDLAIDIRSPTDRIGAILAKVGDLLDAGAQIVWVVDPIRKLVTVYRADGSQAMLGADEMLDGGDVLPDFALSLAALFAE